MRSDNRNVEPNDLNAATVPDAFPTNSMTDILAAQAGKGVWTVMDTDRGYFQIINEPSCIYMTAFEMFRLMWESVRMLFGMTGAPSTFHRNAEVLLKVPRELWPEEISRFFDDIILGSPPNAWASHADVAESIFKSAFAKGWKFGYKKMHFGYQRLAILGVIMTERGIRPNPEKVDTLLPMRIPRNTSELKSYIGLAQWFSEQIPALSWKTNALSHMAHRPGPLRWTETELKEFEFVKSQMRHALTLAVWSNDKTTILYTDACEEGLGCMLVQLQDDVW
jgi:RNase H-like domain found in reverse transcriptase